MTVYFSHACSFFNQVKNVTNDFTQVLSDPRVTFRGNVRVGDDITLQQLQQAGYAAVVLAYGAQVRRCLFMSKIVP
jgi:adrenodoxin-NADP+ reductase